jgi:Flp pilus assembly protein TadB
MGTTSTTTTTETNRPPEGGGPSKGELFEALSNDRRRETLRYLLRQDDGRTTKGEVARHIAARETDKPVAQVTSDERKRVYIALHQTHLPKLHDLGLVEYDSSQGALRLDDSHDGLAVYLDVETADDDGAERQPWRRYYLSIGLTGLCLTAVLATGVGPITAGPGLAVAAALALAVVATGIAQTYGGELSFLPASETLDR